MIRRVVLVKFKEGAGPKEKKEYVEAVHGLAAGIPQIKSLSRGFHVSDGDDALAYFHASIFDFETRDDLQAFLTHPVHLETRDKVFQRIVGERVIVNYEI